MNLRVRMTRGRFVFLWAVALASAGPTAWAGGGYFVLGYGPLAHQSAGTATAIGMDAFAASSNPAKLAFAGNRFDVDLLTFSPHRKIEREGSGTIYDFSSTSNNTLFFLPEGGYTHQLGERLSLGVTLYGNGGLNTEYRDTTDVPGTNANPDQCGDRPGNFFLGCGKLGFDLSQLILAPMLAWQYTPGQSIGIAPLLGYQRIKVYGLQAFEAVSRYPDNVTNRGYDDAFGAGVRVGWFGRVLPWLNLGAAYSTRVYMDEYHKYRGLIADQGDFDIPANFTAGAAIRPHPAWEIGLEIQRIYWGQIPALRNGVLASIEDPVNKPLGSRDGSGFNWRNQTNYRGALAYAATPTLTLRAGYAYGRRPAADDSADSISLGLFAPNPIHQATVGFTWKAGAQSHLHFAYGRYFEKSFRGPSATAGFGVGGEESVTPHVDTVMLGWSRAW